MTRARRSRGGLGRRGALLLAVALAALVAFIVLARSDTKPPPPSSPEPLLARIPAGSILVVEIDLAGLRAHPLGAELLGQGRQIAGLGEVSTICRADPLAQIDRIALAVPELENVGFGLFAEGSFDGDELVACAAEIVRRRGGRPVEESEGGYRRLRDASLDAGSAELAVRDGALILAEPPYMRQALAAPEEAEGVHAELRRLVPPGVVVATAVLSETQRRTLEAELRAQGEPDSPLAALRDGALSLRLGETLAIEAVLRCSDAGACGRIAERLAARRDRLAAEPTQRLLGLSELLGAVTIAPEGDRVTIRAAATLETLAGVVERLRLIEQLMQAPEAPATPPAPPAPSAPVPPDAGERIAPPAPP